MLTFNYESQADLNTDIPAFDPFDLDMSARDRRDVCETYGGRLTWCILAEVSLHL